MGLYFTVLFVFLFFGTSADEAEIHEKAMKCGINLQALGPRPCTSQMRQIDPCNYQCFLNEMGLMDGDKLRTELTINKAKSLFMPEAVDYVLKQFFESEKTGKCGEVKALSSLAFDAIEVLEKKEMYSKFARVC